MPAVLKGWNRRLSLVQVMYLMGGLAEVWHLIIPFRPLGMYWTVWVNTTLALSASGGSTHMITLSYKDVSKGLLLVVHTSSITTSHEEKDTTEEKRLTL